MNAVRTSPLAHLLAARQAQWQDHCGMPLALSFPDQTETAAASLGVCDLSPLRRTGLKGPGAADWLLARGVSVPPLPNSWSPVEEGGLVARLARTEFLVEDGPGGGAVARLAAELGAGIPGVYPVRRQDCALALCGTRLGELLVQVCNVDFSAQKPEERIVTLTSMAGVSVTVLRRDLGRMHCLRVWCDGTMGPYLWETLTGIAEELGGGPIGAAPLLDALGGRGTSELSPP